MSRDYGKVSPRYWTGSTGKALRSCGERDALLLGAYLMTSPHSNMLGLYYLPKSFVGHELGMPIEEVSKALQRLFDERFSTYDDGSEFVWVHEMARWQIGESLKPGDRQCIGIQRMYDALPNNPFLSVWYERYHGAYHLTRRRESARESLSPLPRALDAPSKPGSGSGSGTRAGTGTETHTAREGEKSIFERWQRIKSIYPSVSGHADWLTAERAARRMVEQGTATWDELEAGTQRLRAYVDGGGVSSTRFVMHPVKFFVEIDAPWRGEWQLPAPTAGANVTPIRQGAELTPEAKAERDRSIAEDMLARTVTECRDEVVLAQTRDQVFEAYALFAQQVMQRDFTAAERNAKQVALAKYNLEEQRAIVLSALDERRVQLRKPATQAAG